MCCRMTYPRVSDRAYGTLGRSGSRIKLENEAFNLGVPVLDPERLSECITWIDLSFVERRRTPDWAIQVGIRCHLAGMSLRDASQFLDELHRR